MTDDATVNLEAAEATDTSAKHYKTFTYRLYPSRSQTRCLEATLETCRRWYNQCLEERKIAWEQRQDVLKQLGHSLIQRYDQIAREDLHIANMVRNRHLAKSILDAGWGYLIQHLTHKAAEAGREVHRVDPAYTSKTCSQCGSTFEGLTLADRWVSCCVCGLSLDRDHNAALNILNRAGWVR